jgi:hypothetical protein
MIATPEEVRKSLYFSNTIPQFQLVSFDILATSFLERGSPRGYGVDRKAVAQMLFVKGWKANLDPKTGFHQTR